MSDKGIRFMIDTQEMTVEQMAHLFTYKGSYVKFLIAKPEDTLPKEALVVDQPPPEVGKSPAQRLRAVLYRLFEEQGKPGQFESYYQTQIEKIIEKIKEKLP